MPQCHCAIGSHSARGDGQERVRNASRRNKNGPRLRRDRLSIWQRMGEEAGLAKWMAMAETGTTVGGDYLSILRSIFFTILKNYNAILVSFESLKCALSNDIKISSISSIRQNL